MSYEVGERAAVATQTRAEQVMPRPNVWLRLVSSGWDKPQITVQEREVARRSRLTAYIILALFITAALVLPAGISVPSTLAAVAVVILGCMVAAILNRSGWVTVAGILLVLLLSAAILGSIVSASSVSCASGAVCSSLVTSGKNGQISLVYLPAYDLFTISVIVGASILPRGYTFLIAFANVALIVLDFVLQPHAPDVAAWVAFEGSLPLIARPVALQLIVATVAYLWVRGTDQAIQRADRAEELAQMEHAIAEQKRQLDIGVQQILQTHIRAANGDFGARAPLGQENVLWQVAASLNNLLSRLQKSGQAEYQLRRTEDELRRLAAALDDAQAGRHPLWPAQSGTAVDVVIERLARPARVAAPPSGPGYGNSGSGLPGSRPPVPGMPATRGVPGGRSGPGGYPSAPGQPGVGQPGAGQPGAGQQGTGTQAYGLNSGLGYGAGPGSGRLGPEAGGGMGTWMGTAQGRHSAPQFGAGAYGPGAAGSQPPVVSGPLLPGNPQVVQQPPLPSISQFPPSDYSSANAEVTGGPHEQRIPADEQRPPNNPWAFPFDGNE